MLNQMRLTSCCCSFPVFAHWLCKSVALQWPKYTDWIVLLLSQWFPCLTLSCCCCFLFSHARFSRMMIKSTHETTLYIFQSFCSTSSSLWDPLTSYVIEHDLTVLTSILISLWYFIDFITPLFVSKKSCFNFLLRMAFKDFQRYFSRLELCHLSPEFERLGVKRRWQMTKHHGEWLRNSTAGGCRNYLGQQKFIQKIILFWI